MSRKQSNFGSGTAKPKNFRGREDMLVTQIGEGVISGSAITDVTKRFAEMDRGGRGQFLTMGRPKGSGRVADNLGVIALWFESSCRIQALLRFARLSGGRRPRIPKQTNSATHGYSITG